MPDYQDENEEIKGKKIKYNKKKCLWNLILYSLFKIYLNEKSNLLKIVIDLVIMVTFYSE